METKKFSNVSFHSIPKCRWTNFLLGHDPQSMECALVPMHEEDKTSRGNPPPKFHDPSEILRLSDPLLSCKREGSYHRDPHPHLSAE